ncbi:MAG: helix-turn-helix domain-containing protein [Marinobacter sp.]
MSWLAARSTRVAVLETGAESVLHGSNAADPAIVAVLTGEIRVRSGLGEIRGRQGTTFLLPPLAEVELAVSGDLRVVAAQLASHRSDPAWGSGCLTLPPIMASHLVTYLQRAHFFRNHQHAVTETERLGQSLRLALAGHPEPPGVASGSVPPLDRRIVRAVRLIASLDEPDFSIDRVAGMAGLSTRNLYYLMKRHTGMTPHQFFVSRRLIRVRRSLLECDCDVQTVSRHALSEGFSHLGRFSALYRKHFGEYPRETLQWRLAARQKTDAVIASRCGGGVLQLCLSAGW